MGWIEYIIEIILISISKPFILSPNSKSEIRVDTISMKRNEVGQVKTLEKRIK